MSTRVETLRTRRPVPAGMWVTLLVAALAAAAVAIGVVVLTHEGAPSAARVTARAPDIQESRADAIAQAYEDAWTAVQPTEWRVAVAGTGPGLTLVADRQSAWAGNAVTGTGPGLVTIAEMQGEGSSGVTPTGTGPGLEHLGDGSATAILGTP